jgi:hypothetical protein
MNTNDLPVSGTGEHSAAFAESEACPRNCPTPKRPISPARLRANRQNAKNSSGPRSEEGKKRSSLNATRHGLLAQTLHLPEEEMAAYHEFTDSFVKGMSPVGVVETQLAHACADLQFRLNRVAAAEHNLFSIGHVEQGDLWDPGHPEAHTALAFAETLRNSPDPLKNLSIYEQRLSRRFLQTFKQLREMQAERRELEQDQLDEMWSIVSSHPSELNTIEPAQLGFVCSTRAWRLYVKRQLLLGTIQKGSDNFPPSINSRQLLRQAA